VTFVEIGSLPEQWCDKKAGEAVARAVMAAATAAGGCRNAVAVGGIHYAPLHTQVVLMTDIGVGHLLPKYVKTDETLIEKAIARTSGKVDVLLLDRKGATPEQRLACQKTAEKLGMAVVRAGDLISRRM
jgi:D-aminoacyl-tRNA deacylase